MRRLDSMEIGRKRATSFRLGGAPVSKPVQWKLFIRKRGSATQGVPPGKDDLKWVANTTTLIYGEQEALLVDTFLSSQQRRQRTLEALLSQNRSADTAKSGADDLRGCALDRPHDARTVWPSCGTGSAAFVCC